MRISRLSALAITAVLAGACDEGTVSPLTKESVSLDFCAGSGPLWFAIQNETEAWQEVTASAGETFTFDATPRVSIAYVIADATDYSTEIINVERAELDGISGQACSEAGGTKALSGTVTGLTGQQVGRLSMALETDGVTTGTPGFSFGDLPDGPLDLVATRYATVSTQPPDRIIVRRDLNLATGATIPALDFGSAESQPLTSSTVTWANRGADPVNVTTEFFSTNGTYHLLMQMAGGTGTGNVFISVPAAMRGANDLHLLSAFTSAAAGTREVSQVYANPSDRTFTFGPILNAPTASIVATTPYRRPGLSVASQTEYPTAMEAFFSQLTGSSFRTVTIFTSAAFLGGRPTTWVLEMPDLSAAGYESTWALQPTVGAGAQVNANARGFDADVSLLLGAAPSDGDMLKSSIRSAGNFNALQFVRSSQSYRARALRRD